MRMSLVQKRKALAEELEAWNLRPTFSNSRTFGFHLSATVHISAMAKRYQIEFISTYVELINDPIVTNAGTEFGTSLQPLMRKAFQSSAQIPQFGFDSLLQMLGQSQEKRVEFTGIDLGGLFHFALGPANATLTQVRLATFDAGNELRIKFSLIFKVIG